MVHSTRNHAAPTAPSSFHKAYIWTISLVAALGGLLFGYDWVVIGGAKPFYEQFFQLSDPAQQGWAMSCALIGCLIGAVLAAEGPSKPRAHRAIIHAGKPDTCKFLDGEDGAVA